MEISHKQKDIDLNANLLTGNSQSQMETRESTEPKEQSKDNRTKAIIAINGFALSSVLTAVSFKSAQQDGVSLADAQLWRNIVLFILSSISVASQGINPIKEFPSAHKLALLIRLIAGQSVFYLYFIAVRNAPLTLITTIARTDAFWILIMGLLINGEKIILIEAIGIVVCFATIAAMFRFKDNETES